MWASKTFFWLKTACRSRFARVPGELRFITGYAARSGIVVVIAEQMAALALKVSRQGLVLRRGSVVLAGTGEELLHGQDGKALAASYL